MVLGAKFGRNSTEHRPEHFLPYCFQVPNLGVRRLCLIKHVLAVLIACPFHQKTPARLSSGSPVCTAWIGSIVLFLPAAFFGG